MACNHRWFQFRLRTLSLGVLVIAICLGWYVSRARRQEELYQAIYRSNSFAYYDYQVVNNEFDPTRESWAPQWLHQKLGTDFVHAVVKVHFWEDVQQGRADLSQVDGFCQRIDAFPQVQFVRLELGTDDRLAGIGRLRNLRRLEIANGEQMTDRGVEALASLTSLRHLDLSVAQISKDGLRVIGGLRDLEVLIIHSKSLPRDSIARLAQVASLRELRLGYNDAIDVDGQEVEGLRNLEVLELDRCHVSNEDLAGLAGLTKLRVLEIGPCNSRVTEKGIEHLASLSGLERLHILNVLATENDLMPLARLRHLSEVHITGPNLRDGESLKSALPNCKVYVSNQRYGTAY